MQREVETGNMVGKELTGTSVPGAVFLIGLMIVAAIDMSYISINWGPFDSPEMVRGVTLHQEYYTMDNALGLAKLYLDTSLRYSVYQAMYDNGYMGGLSELPGGGEYAVWYDNGDSYPEEKEILGNLEAPALANLGRYTESDYVFLDSYSVKLPEYTGIDIGETREGDMVANASEDRNLFISKTTENLDRIELEKNATLSESFGKAYLELYQKALGVLEEAKCKFKEIRDLLGEVKEGSLTREKEGSRPMITDDEVFLETLKEIGIMDAASRKDGEIELERKTDSILNSLGDSIGEIAVQFWVLKDKDEKTGENKKSISLKESKCTETEPEERKVGDRIFYEVTKTCSFTYDYNFTMKASVTDNSGKSYPVFNARKGEVSFEPLTFVFTAKEYSPIS